MTLAAPAAALLSPPLARADEGPSKRYVAVHSTRPPLHFSADAGIGVAQYEKFTTDPMGNPVSQGNRAGGGTNLEGAIGIPFIGELGVRLGYRFDENGSHGQADHFARLFDPIVSNPGLDSFANPEIRLRSTVLPLEVVEVGLESRFVIPTASNSSFGLTAGLPVRIHIPHFLRIDTGPYLPMSFSSPLDYSVDVPVQAFFQVGDAFFGPFSGFRYNHHTYVDAFGMNQTDDSTDIPVGVGGGYTLAGMVDLKAQLRTERINSGQWAKGIGGGIGVGLRFP
jgi:hypothetical protein